MMMMEWWREAGPMSAVYSSSGAGSGSGAAPAGVQCAFGGEWSGGETILEDTEA